MRSKKDYILLFFKGIGMGGADVVPGVSGGTVAFITGIYEEFLDSIKSVNFDNLKLLFTGNFKSFWANINGGFLVTLFLGILISVKSLATLMAYLIQAYPIQLWSFFFGLIIISSMVVLRQVAKWNIGVVLSIGIGIASAYLITSSTPASTPDSLIMVFISGTVAICAMILPGISGAFILLILGKYKYVVEALSNMDIVVILTFAAGCLVGISSFARVVAWLLKKYHNIAIAILSGFMLGSLNKIWPWKQVLEFRLDSHGKKIPFIETNILPSNFYQTTGQDPFILQAILFMAIGFFLVVVIEKIALMIESK